VKLAQVHHNTLLEYTQFLDETDPAYVLEHVIANTLAKDREFMKWQAGRLHLALKGGPPASAGSSAV
jgi:hypothetical protein